MRLDRGILHDAHVKNVHRPADVLDLVLAAIDEGVVNPEFGDVAHSARYRDAARLGDRLDARGEIDAVAKNVLVLLVDDHFAQVNADCETACAGLRSALH